MERNSTLNLPLRVWKSLCILPHLLGHAAVQCQKTHPFWGGNGGRDSENYKECISEVQVLALRPLEKGLIPLIWSHLDYVDLFDFSLKGQFFNYLRVVLTHILPGSSSHFISHFSCFHTVFPTLLHGFQRPLTLPGPFILLLIDLLHMINGECSSSFEANNNITWEHNLKPLS